MKAFVALFALVALVAADADPLWSLPLAYNRLAYSNLAMASSPGMITYANGATVPMDTPAVNAAKINHLNAKALTYANRWAVPAVHRLLKRDAEADADADPFMMYTNTWGNAWASPLAYRTGLPLATAGLPLATTAYSSPIISSPLMTPFTYSAGIYGLPTMKLVEKKEEEKKDEMKVVSVEKRDADSQILLPSAYNTMLNTAPLAINRPITTYSGIYSGLYNPARLYNPTGLYNRYLL